METVNGDFIMKGCEESSVLRLKNISDLYKLVASIGFIPLFSNSIAGFSVEERVTAEQWWTEDVNTDPWEWRIVAASNPDIAYGKFFDSKAGFVSKEWFPVFANYRRNGYDFDALFEDELASYRSKKIMDVFGIDDDSVGKELMTYEVKKLAGFGKREDGTTGEKNFDGVLTGLYMQTYLIMSDFRRKKNRKGQEYGWHIAAVETPETKWGYDFVTSCYKEAPCDSWKRIVEQMRRHFPDAEDANIEKVLGIKYPGSGTDSSSEVGSSRRNTSGRGYERKNPRPQELPWPENIITEMGIKDVMGTETYEPLTDDQIEGLWFAISTLKDNEEKVLKIRYEEHKTLEECGREMELSKERVRQMAKKGIRKLRHPSRSVYIREGYQAYLERKEQERIHLQKKLNLMTDEERMDFLEGISVYEVGFSARSYNCLCRAGLRSLADVVRKVDEGNEEIVTGWGVRRKGLLSIRNLGRKSAMEILNKLEEYGVDVADVKVDYRLDWIK